MRLRRSWVAVVLLTIALSGCDEAEPGSVEPGSADYEPDYQGLAGDLQDLPGVSEADWTSDAQHTGTWITTVTVDLEAEVTAAELSEAIEVYEQRAVDASPDDGLLARFVVDAGGAPRAELAARGDEETPAQERATTLLAARDALPDATVAVGGDSWTITLADDATGADVGEHVRSILADETLHSLPSVSVAAPQSRGTQSYLAVSFTPNDTRVADTWDRVMERVDRLPSGVAPYQIDLTTAGYQEHLPDSGASRTLARLQFTIPGMTGEEPDPQRFPELRTLAAGMLGDAAVDELALLAFNGEDNSGGLFLNVTTNGSRPTWGPIATPWQRWARGLVRRGPAGAHDQP